MWNKHAAGCDAATGHGGSVPVCAAPALFRTLCSHPSHRLSPPLLFAHLCGCVVASLLLRMCVTNPRAVTVGQRTQSTSKARRFFRPIRCAFSSSTLEAYNSARTRWSGSVGAHSCCCECCMIDAGFVRVAGSSCRLFRFSQRVASSGRVRLGPL